jgi:MOSC domain-containing protein YiiM
VEHLDLAALEAGVDEIRRSPREEGRVELIVRRPAQGERERLAEATLDTADGLVGDNWKTRGSSRRPDGSPNPKAQLTIKNARMAALVAQAPERWELAGDQLYVDFDLSTENIPPGTRLEIGSAVVEVTDEPHTGCRKYHDRFGNDALRLVSSETGRALNLRGINTRVVVAGVVRTGDRVSKASS